MNETWGSQFTNQLERVTKLVVGVTAVVYLTGFIVECIYLGRYHVTSLSLLKGEYILAGFWTWAPLLCGMIADSFFNCFDHVADRWIPWLGWRLHHAIRPGLQRLGLTTTGRFLWHPARFAMSIVLSSIVATPLILAVVVIHVDIGEGQFTPISHSDMVGLSAVLGFISATLWLLSQRACHAMSQLINSRPSAIHSRHAAAMSAIRNGFLALLVFTFYIGLFVAFGFPRIPVYFGGGKPLVVQFILKESKHSPIAAILKTEGDPARSVPYALLRETDDSFLILDEAGPAELRTIRIPRDSIAAIETYFPRQPWQHKSSSTTMPAMTSPAGTFPAATTRP